uniref:non-specific serine/threonine protein kinase n=1 Tax=Oryza glumipatula TaxID=40148 RepID=A0A0D9YP59_9ORYZ
MHSMGAARLRIRLQAALVMSLLLLQIMPFLPCTLATGGNSAELLMGREKHEGNPSDVPLAADDIISAVCARHRWQKAFPATDHGQRDASRLGSNQIHTMSSNPSAAASEAQLGSGGLWHCHDDHVHEPLLKMSTPLDRLARSSRPISLEYRNIRQVRASSYILAISKIASLTALSTNSKMIRLFASCPKLIPLLAVFIFSSSLSLAISDDTDTDREALLCFKSQISDPNGALSSWTNTSLNFCSWQGVSCNSTQTQLRVMALNVSSKGLGGLIPPCIGNLSSIASLDLSNNAFLGKIPSELGRLGQISYLNLSINSLEGRIPYELTSCRNLQVLGLWNNSLQGEIPPSLTQCTHLQQVMLSNNKLEGEIPTGFGTLRELKTLDLSNNALTGDIPPLLGSSPSFIYVDLGVNQLTGGIPEFLANSSSLQVIRLMQNGLTGEIPLSLFNSSTLTTIYLNRNNLVGSIPPITAVAAPIQYLSLAQNKLTGGIPASLGNLSSMVLLSLGANSLVGSIPESLSKIQTLERLVLTYNKLSGNVPQNIFNMTSLKYFGMANNSLIGRLPPDIGNRLPNLETLILSTTQLNGPIPASLANMSKLEMIYLTATGLTGVVPSFGSLPNLQDLDLGYNQLEAGDWSFLSSLANCTQLKKFALDANFLQGTLPRSVGNLPSQLNWLFLKQNKLSGAIPSEIGNLKSLTVMYMDNNMFSGSIQPTIGNLSNLLVLSFARNNLSGHIPDSIGSLSQLTEFYIDGNNLNGSIPANIGQWRQLEKLDLSHNFFGGSLPSEVFNISSLSKSLDLSYNLFTGPIPLEIGNLINLGSISISNNRLNGEIPFTLGNCVLLEYLHMEGNLLTGSIPQSFMNLKSIKDDFGLARFMCATSTAAPGNSTSLADLKGSIGYIAPEILTGKRPTDEKFNDGLSLHDRVDAAFPHRVTEILDPNMLHNDLDGGNSELMQSCVLPLKSSTILTSEDGARPGKPPSPRLQYHLDLRCWRGVAVAVAHRVFSGGSTMPFLPCTLATGGKPLDLLIMAGREKHEGHRLLAPSKSIRSPRTLLHENWTGPEHNVILGE